MRSHSFFQDQKLTVLTPLTFSSCDVKAEHAVEETKVAETKKYLVKQEPLNKIQTSSFKSADYVDGKELLPSFFGIRSSVYPLQTAVASKVEKLLFTGQYSPIAGSVAPSFPFSGKFYQNKRIVRKTLSLMHLLTCSQVRRFFQSGDCEKIKLLKLPFFIELIKLQNFARDAKLRRETTIPTVQVVLVFSSFEKRDLNWAFHLFQNYITNLTNLLTAYNCIETGLSLYSEGMNPDFDAKDTKLRPRDFVKKPFLTKTCSQVRKLGVNRLHFPRKYKDGVEIGAKLEAQLFPHEATLKQEKHLIERKTFRYAQSCGAVAGIVKAVRALNEPFRATSIPLPTQLYTVIRSPHVFKKTREQFATTQYKRAIKLSFGSNAALRLLIDSLILLKLPAEIKVAIRDL